MGPGRKPQDLLFSLTCEEAHLIIRVNCKDLFFRQHFLELQESASEILAGNLTTTGRLFSKLDLFALFLGNSHSILMK